MNSDGLTHRRKGAETVTETPVPVEEKERLTLMEQVVLLGLKDTQVLILAKTRAHCLFGMTIFLMYLEDAF